MDISTSARPAKRTHHTQRVNRIGSGGVGVAGCRFVLRAIGASPAWMRLSLCLALVGLFGIVAGTIAQGQGNVVPGVVVLGVPVGGLSHDDAAVAIRARVEHFETQRVTIEYGGRRWQPTLRELGIAVDVETAIARAESVGRGRDAVGGILRLLQLQGRPILIEPPLLVDREALAAYGAGLMAELEIAPVEADLMISGESVLVSQDSAGYVVNTVRLRQDLIRELRGFTLPTIELEVTLEPATVRSDDLQYGLAQIATALSQPLILYTTAEQWTIPPGELVRHVRLDDSAGAPAVVIDDDAIRSIVDGVAGEIDQEARSARASETGPYLRVLAPREGRTVDRDQFEIRIHQAITLGAHEVEIPVEVTPGDASMADVLDEYGLTDELATGSSNFAGSSAGRVTNIRQAAELIDGTLIPAGGGFSFNEALGMVSSENGFVPAGLAEAAIAGYDVGGGICQLSTSLFRAALLSGLPIDEWWSHPYRTSSYELGGWAPGFDAMVQPGQLDFRFTNATDDWIMIRATISAASELTVTLLGSDPGFAVELSDPVYDAIVPSDGGVVEELDYTAEGDVYELWQPARDGVTVYIHRSVWAADGTLLIDEDYVATYWPQGPVYRVGADVAGVDSPAGQ